MIITNRKYFGKEGSNNNINMILFLILRLILNSTLITYKILQKTYKTLISDASLQQCIKLSGAVVFTIEIGNNHSKTVIDI